MTIVDLLYSTELSSAAVRLTACADDLRTRAGSLHRAGAACAWDGAGARAFRHRAGDTTAQLSRAADLLEHAGTALRSHGDAVAAALAARAPR